MYWIYLTIFAVTIFVPELITQSFWGLPLLASQELTLLFLGLINFGVFLIYEKRKALLKQERAGSQREINRLTRDLTASYSYIGETNRKLEILKTIIMEVPVSDRISLEKERAIFHGIIQAAHILTKSDKILLIIKKEGVGTIKEFKSDDKVDFSFNKYVEQEKLSSGKEIFFENEQKIVFASEEHFDGTRACLVILKDVSHRTIEDVDMMKTLVAYAMFIYQHCQASKNFFHHKHHKN